MPSWRGASGPPAGAGDPGTAADAGVTSIEPLVAAATAAEPSTTVETPDGSRPVGRATANDDRRHQGNDEVPDDEARTLVLPAAGVTATGAPSQY